MSNRGLKLKSVYRPSSKLEVFYTGGATCVSSKGLLACSCNDEVKLVDAASGSVTSTLAGDTEPVTALAFSPSGNRLYGASRSLQQRCWDVSNNAIVRSWKGHKGPVLALAVDPTGGLLASASADRSCRVWDTDGFYCTHAFHGHRGLVLEVIFHPKELMIITAGDDAEVRVWDLITKSCVATLKDHFSAVTSLSLSPDGWTLLTASRDKVAILWDLRSHKKLVTVPVFEAVEGAMIIPDTSAFKSMVQSALGPSGQKSRALVFATGGEKGVLKLWRADTGDCIYEQRQGIASSQGQTPAAGEEIRELHMLPNSEGLMVATGDCRLLFFSPEEEAERHVLKLGRQLIGNLDEVTDVRLIGPPSAPTQLVLATNSPTIRMFDLSTMSCSTMLTGHTDTVLVLDAIYAQDSKTLLASGAKDNSIRVWDEAGSCIAVGQGHVGAVSALAFSRRALNFLVSGGADKLLKVWDVSKLLEGSTSGDAAGKVPRLRATAAVAAHDKDINALAVSPNDALICTASQDRTAKVWRLPDLVQTLTLKGHRRGVWSAQFSPVDQCVLTGSGDATIRLWALADGSCLRTFEGHGASVLRASFISAGTQVVSAGADGLVKLWGVRTSECTATFDEHEGKVWALAVAGDNDAVLATGGADACVNVWRDCTAEDEAAAVANRTQAAVKAQELSNALKDNDYQAAAAMAFELGHAGQLRSVVEAACAQGQEKAEEILNSLVAGFGADQIKQCLECVREWNTNSRHCHAAQATLQAILMQHAPEVLLDIPGVAALLDGLSAYTQRHMVRIDRLRRSVALLDYTLGAMRVVAPQEPASAREPAPAQPQPAAQLAEPVPAPPAAAQPMMVEVEDLEPHSSESDLTAATGLERPLGDDEDDIDLEEIDIRSIERVSPRSPRMVTDAASLAHLQDEVESRDRRQQSAAAPSTAVGAQEGLQGDEAVQGKKRRRKGRQMIAQEKDAAAADDAAGTEEVREDNGMASGESPGGVQQDKQQEKKKQKKPSGAKTSKLKRPATPAIATRRSSRNKSS